jgi:hypothetical protein
MLLFPSIITRALAPVVVDIMFDHAGNYDRAMWLMIGLLTVAIIMPGVGKRKGAVQPEKVSLLIGVENSKRDGFSKKRAARQPENP